MKWINVKDRLPEDQQDVLVYKKNGRIIICGFNHMQFFCAGVWHAWIDQTDQVLHWMSLPKVPTK